MIVELYYKQREDHKDQHRGKKLHGVCTEVQMFQGSWDNNYWAGQEEEENQESSRAMGRVFCESC